MDFWNCDWDSVARSAGKGTDAMLSQAAEVNRALLDLNADRLAVLVNPERRMPRTAPPLPHAAAALAGAR